MGNGKTLRFIQMRRLAIVAEVVWTVISNTTPSHDERVRQLYLQILAGRLTSYMDGLTGNGFPSGGGLGELYSMVMHVLDGVLRWVLG